MKILTHIKKKTMDYEEMMLMYAPKGCAPTVIGSAEAEALKETAKKYHKKVNELTDEEKAEAEKLGKGYRNAMNDPLDAYRG